MEITNLLIILLIGLIIYYVYASSKTPDITEGFKKKKNPFRKMSRSIKSIGKKKKRKSKAKKKVLSLDAYNAAIVQIISKASDQTSVQATTKAWAAGIKTFFEEAYRTNLKLTDAGAALSEEEFEAKAVEGITTITNGGIKGFGKWFNNFITPPEPAETEAGTESSGAEPTAAEPVAEESAEASE